eukprot:CAMPEP_0113320828 /NCGR_PEP_ID=MMETSP0010_2-20120614/14518_1 /TAXON_ID=216773 ORGANISM="Corethron hystrix, Strain 308" /NCGR_SAMPLE_ID=MMETSP0010_2 /ASSEMBLY_ACC=CAM_ASM_000155 /LENGTH=46 /DNA_ID=CAMNT_0000178763 /DNA_START=102 /DNA_END=242 /DNA_ORIENTATION=+ /assembly_acc=CAM_ASM_000155
MTTICPICSNRLRIDADEHQSLPFILYVPISMAIDPMGRKYAGDRK